MSKHRIWDRRKDKRVGGTSTTVNLISDDRLRVAGVLTCRAKFEVAREESHDDSAQALEYRRIAGPHFFSLSQPLWIVRGDLCAASSGGYDVPVCRPRVSIFWKPAFKYPFDTLF